MEQEYQGPEEGAKLPAQENHDQWSSEVNGAVKGDTSFPRENRSNTPRAPSTCNGRFLGGQVPRVMVVSLHSCGNLIHHGLRSLLLNRFVVAVAMIGCCYNLVTERLGPPTYKLPSLRFSHPRVMREGAAYDPHGFPMSQQLISHQHKRGRGIRFNITARMMAVQAPQNWTPDDSNAFFTRHFFRALLQRLFLDYGVVQPTLNEDQGDGKGEDDGVGATDPIIIGSLRKPAIPRSERTFEAQQLNWLGIQSANRISKRS